MYQPEPAKHVLYLRTWDEYRLDAFTDCLSSRWRVTFQPIHGMGTLELSQFDVIYVPSAHDQIFLQTQTGRLLDYLDGGGNMVINGHFARPWLPFLKPFHAVPRRPFTNLMIRPHEPGRYFGRMDYETYHRHKGILGQYARGWSEPPEGAQWLSMIGPPDDLHPVDWVWRHPGGGNVFVHSGDSIHWFHSGLKARPSLLLDILEAVTGSGDAGDPLPMMRAQILSDPGGE